MPTPAVVIGRQDGNQRAAPCPQINAQAGNMSGINIKNFMTAVNFLARQLFDVGDDNGRYNVWTDLQIWLEALMEQNHRTI